MTVGRGWSLQDVPWDRFDRSRIDPNILQLVKAASLVEYNSEDYAQYLCNIFPDDPEFSSAARAWALEEVRHGEALGRWAKMADPSFDLAAAAARFRSGYRIAVEATNSVRGSRAGELVARCIVETGTSSYYSALAAATDEPVLKEICHRIAGDEFRHYKLFHQTAKRYLKIDRIGRLRRIAIALGRIGETEDDELAFAFHAANAAAGSQYRRQTAAARFIELAYPLYREADIARAVGMTLKAVGLRAGGVLHYLATGLAGMGLRLRVRRAMAAV
jgi:rubrerythrin